MKTIASICISTMLALSISSLLPGCGAEGAEPDDETGAAEAKGAMSVHIDDACGASCAGGAPDGACSPGESSFNCAPDCSCGDGQCDGLETALSCPVDCKFPGSGQPNEGPSCGNGRCDPWEVTAGGIQCVQDCKLAPDPVGTTCGDYTCEPGETSATCPADCGNAALCGNGACDVNKGEHFEACPIDCPNFNIDPGLYVGSTCVGPSLYDKYSDGSGSYTTHLVANLAGGCDNAYPWRLLYNAGTCNTSQLMKPDGGTCTIAGALCSETIDGRFSVGATYFMAQDPNKCGHYFGSGASFHPVEWKKLDSQTCTMGSPCTTYDCSGLPTVKTSGNWGRWVPQLARWSIYAKSCQ